jgi:hypothetical protein
VADSPYLCENSQGFQRAQIREIRATFGRVMAKIDYSKIENPITHNNHPNIHPITLTTNNHPSKYLNINQNT